MGLTHSSAADYFISRWALVEDYGDGVFLWNALNSPLQSKAIRERTVVLELLGAVGAGEQRQLSSSETAMARTLERMGIVVRSNQDDPKKVPVEFPFALAKIQIERPISSTEQGIQFSRYVQLLGRRHLPTIAISVLYERLDQASLSGFAEAMRGLGGEVRKVSPTTKTLWRILASEVSVESSTIAKFLDAHQDVQLVLTNTDEQESDWERDARQIELIALLAEEGFRIGAVVSTVLSDEVSHVVAALNKANNQAGVDVELLVLEGPRTNSRRLSVLGELENALGQAIDSSAPWGDILRYSMTPARIRRLWDMQHQEAFLSCQGKWARSRIHAKRGLFEDLSDVHPHLYSERADEGTQIPHEVQSVHTPDCMNCPVEPICPGYLTTEYDVCVRLGLTIKAEEAASLACEIRLRLLTKLVEALRNDSAERAGILRGSVQATYEGRQLILHREERNS